VISESYALEYGTDALEMHVGALGAGQRVLLVDDLIATGGTLAAGARLVRRAGAVPVEACCIIELPELGVRARFGLVRTDRSANRSANRSVVLRR
jgi:adenine phosphoribosyltransferase